MSQIDEEKYMSRDFRNELCNFMYSIVRREVIEYMTKGGFEPYYENREVQGEESVVLPPSFYLRAPGGGEWRINFRDTELFGILIRSELEGMMDMLEKGNVQDVLSTIIREQIGIELGTKVEVK